MKAKLFSQLSAIGAFAAISILGSVVETVQAQVSSEQSQQASSAAITIEVPVGSEPVKYTVDGEEREVVPGSILQIPANATNIQLTTGAIMKATRELPSGGAKIAQFTAANGFTFPSLRLSDVRRALRINVENISSPDVYINTPSGEIVRNPNEQLIVQEIARIANVVQQNAADAETTSGVGGTDGRG